MKKLLILLILPAMMMLPGCSKHAKDPVTRLPVTWKFIQGDDLNYLLPGFDDSAWKEIRTDKIWEEQGYDPYDGFAWFRVKVLIPSSLKDSSFLKDSLRIYLGKINNFDQTFLNGEMIGSNGVNVSPGTMPDSLFLKAPMQLYDLPRRYTLARDDNRIRWDSINVIAVRVFDQGGQGGIYTGHQVIGMTSLAEYFLLDHGSSPFVFNGNKLNKAVALRNKSDHYRIKGILSLEAINKVTGAELLREKRRFDFAPGEEADFSFTIDSLEQSAMISYRFEFDGPDTTILIREESPYICTPMPPATPRINGPVIYGQRPGKPFLYCIPCSGDRPVTFSAQVLPEGLQLDRNTGIITGKVMMAGSYKVTLTAENALGKSERNLEILIGDQLALTPPMGWNSWNCWGLSVDAGKVIASARTFCNKGLIQHGWSFINIDDGWEIFKDQEPKRDPAGNILTNEKFPDMKALGDSIHAMGLKFGIYSSPGPLTCGQYTASWQHELKDARSYASWGVDYLKYDWCSYNNIAKDTSLAERKKPYFVMRDALKQVDRDIVYSLCQYGMSKVWEWGAEVGGNLWRTTGDITDTWESMKEIGFSQVENAPYAGPGHWNDPDMLVVGWVGWGPNLHPTRLTPDEQYTHISLWSLLSAPLLIGCDLERLDPFTLNLLTNDEVLAIDQDPLGRQATPVVRTDSIQVWVKHLADGKKAFGVFNLSDHTIGYAVDLKQIGIPGEAILRDLWRQKDLGSFSGEFTTLVPSHGVVLLKETD